VREETEFLDAYSELVDGVDDEAICLLIRLVLEDERRHHAMFEDMTKAILGEDGSATLQPPRPTPEDARRLLGPTERFLEAEEDDRARLRKLRRELRPMRDDTLWPLLVELMEIDTAKHVLILGYLRRQLREAAKG
jgi:rubrerythrin